MAAALGVDVDVVVIALSPTSDSASWMRQELLIGDSSSEAEDGVKWMRIYVLTSSC